MDLKDKNHNPGPRKLTQTNLDKVRAVVNEDKRRTVRQIAAQVPISKSSTHTALRKLGLHKTPSTWVPHLLNPVQKLRRVT